LASDAIGPARLLRGTEIKICDSILCLFSSAGYLSKSSEQQEMGGTLERSTTFEEWISQKQSLKSNVFRKFFA
jgi:hypothetical protein